MELKDNFNFENKKASEHRRLHERERAESSTTSLMTLNGDGSMLAVFLAAGGITRGRGTLVRLRVRTHATKELRFPGMHPTRALGDAYCGSCSHRRLRSLASPFSNYGIRNIFLFFF